jgi:hypothetical protein
MQQLQNKLKEDAHLGKPKQLKRLELNWIGERNSSES